MDVGEILQIINNLVQLDMDVAQNQLAIKWILGEGGGGCLYYNYKRFHSIMLLCLVDVDYKFVWADVGSNGVASDAQIFTNYELKEAIEANVIGFPSANPLPNDDRDTPYFMS